MTRSGTYIFRFLMLLVFFAGAGAGVLQAYMPESAEARRVMLDYMMEPLQADQEIRREVLPQQSGVTIFFRTYEQLGGRYYGFKPMDADGEWAIESAGTWIIRRRIDDGEIDQVKVFLQNDTLSFLRLVADRRSRFTRMDVVIAGVDMYRGVFVPLTMERVLTIPFTMLQESTSGVVDWNLLQPDPMEPGYHRIESIVQRLREELPALRDADDGAMDEMGRLVYIKTGQPQEGPGGFNCSGFAKWVMDGFYRPRTGRFLPIEPLKEKHRDYRGTSWSSALDDLRDPYFGLDWTRNLALHMYALDRQVAPETLSPGLRDVRDIRSADRIDHVGYHVEDLRHVLYRLALQEPGTLYLGSINRSFGEELILRQHTHVVVLLPWFDRDGRFRVAVLERNQETGTQSLAERYRGDFIHLVRVEAGRDFDPPPLPPPSDDD
ncbi:MAG: hypothetical protein EA427_15515 [Spirochaetaceae bacterium]|nr:MAG: hypothetical protein EA427_15515 [Spirochaetaceae bacterium]